MEEAGIAKVMRKRREELHLTQRQIALHVGVTESAVSRWETGGIGNMRRDRIAKLAGILKLSPLFIMGVDEADIKSPPPLSPEQETLLNDFDLMNQEGQQMALGIIKSLRTTHPKEVLLNDNTFNNNGEVKNNFVAFGGHNSVNQNVTVGD